MYQVEEKASEDVSTILVGNKSDLQAERLISKEEGEDLASEYKALFMETSAKNGTNIKEAFMTLLEKIIPNIEK